MTIHSRQWRYVEFLYDRAVSCPAAAVGEAGDVMMLPEPLAKKLLTQGYGRLTSDIIDIKDLEPKPDEPVDIDDQVVRRLVTAGFVRAGEIDAKCNKIIKRLLKEYATKEYVVKQRPRKESTDDTGENGSDVTDGGSDIQSGDGGKTPAVRNRKRGKGVGAPAGGARSKTTV